ncbi:hypothetical protein M758_7G117700 [Ceratodon purpureus]|nr:hypothetical protein M758_7G117700 [Ceratodon purpureus]
MMRSFGCSGWTFIMLNLDCSICIHAFENYALCFGKLDLTGIALSECLQVWKSKTIRSTTGTVIV